MARVDTPCTPELFWAEVALIGWSDSPEKKFYDKAKARLLRRWTGEFLEEFNEIKDELQSKLARAVEAKEQETGESTGCGDDGWGDLMNHVIGLGKEEYEASLADPMRVIKRGQAYNYAESFGYCVPYGSDIEYISKGLYIKRAREIVENLTQLKQSRFGGDFEDLEPLLQLMMRVVNGRLDLLQTEGLGERVAKLRKEREARLRVEREALRVLDPQGWLFDNTVSDARTYLGDSDEETAA
jgi:hypothetical protein